MPRTDVCQAAFNKRRALPKGKQVDMLLDYAAMNRGWSVKLAGTLAEVIADDDGVYTAGTRHYDGRDAVRQALTKVLNR